MNFHKRLIGRRFGYLTVVAFAGLAKGRKTLWECVCKCGMRKVVRNDSLKDGSTRSCGCMMNPVGNNNKGWKGYGEISKSLWNRIMKDANKRNLSFTITIEYIWNLYLEQNRRCSLTNEVIVFGTTKMDRERTASLDRINSDDGYVVGNVQWVTKTVNFAKQSMSNEEFIELCEKVTKHAGVA